MRGHAAILAAALLGAVACGGSEAGPRSMERGLIVLGIDGMDPKLLDRFMDEGRTPNLKRLAERGSYMPLQTSNPPQSPVAWSTFITGMDAGGHGIYDFVHRDNEALEPYLSTSRAEEPDCVAGMPNPFESGGVELLREGRAFWLYLDEANVPSTVVKVPANFPPVESEHARTLAGMGTPDLLGTPGTFQLFTDDPDWAERKVDGGMVQPLDFGGGQTARVELAGPPEPCSDGSEYSLPLEVVADRRRPVALIRAGGQDVLLEEGEWSGWVPVTYDAGMLVGEIPGMVRFHLRSVRPHVYLYASPVNLDPMDPVMPISTPPEYATELARDTGRFYTQNMPEDTKALTGKALSDEEFLEQADLVFEERVEMLHRELERYDGGFFFFYFGEIDQIGHMYHRSLDPDAPEEIRRYAEVIPELYEEMDEVVGEVLERAGGDVDVVVMSDHGFAHYRRKVHLNNWLASQGYLSLREEAAKGSLGHIDWESTQAYALGLNQLFLNVRGREAHGVVPPEEKEVLLRRLERQLLRVRDPETGERVVTHVERPPAGEFGAKAPDLLVGYNRGFRSSDPSAIGQVVNGPFIQDNTSHWNGDHCMDPRHVPGVLLTTRPVSAERPSLVDLAPTILSYFGVPRPEEMEGADLWDDSK